MTEIERIEAPGKAIRVTFYEDRAEVVRRADVRIRAGLQWILVADVTPFVDDRSVQAKTSAAGVCVLMARVRRRITQQGALDKDAIARLEDEERSARHRVQSAERATERAQAEQRRLADLFAEWRRSLSQVPQGAQTETIAAWRDAYAAIADRLSHAAQTVLAAQVEQEDSRKALARAQTRLTQARTTRPICEAVIEVQLKSEAPAEIALEATYRTPCALWRPEHLARLVTSEAEPEAAKLEIVTSATVWQRTGESWESVRAIFSTARPGRTAVPPLLNDDLLATRRTSDGKKVIAEVRDQAIAVAGLPTGTRATDEMPGVDDGGLPLAFTPGTPMSLPSDGNPLRIEINRVVLDATVARVLLPECAGVAHTRATATLKDNVPLLAGPVRLARGAGLVGRSRLGFVAPGEPFELGFGPDDALRVRRTEESTREEAAITGTKTLSRNVKLFLSNLSDAPKKVEITERIPVSEIEGVDVVLGKAPGFAHDARDGFLRAHVTVTSRETRRLSITYEIRAKSKVVLPF